MSALYTPSIHPRINQRKIAGPVLVADSIPARGALGRFNARFGLAVTVAVGSMWAAYIFTVLA